MEDDDDDDDGDTTASRKSNRRRGHSAVFRSFQPAEAETHVPRTLRIIHRQLNDLDSEADIGQVLFGAEELLRQK